MKDNFLSCLILPYSPGQPSPSTALKFSLAPFSNIPNTPVSVCWTESVNSGLESGSTWVLRESLPFSLPCSLNENPRDSVTRMSTLASCDGLPECQALHPVISNRIQRHLANAGPWKTSLADWGILTAEPWGALGIFPGAPASHHQSNPSWQLRLNGLFILGWCPGWGEETHQKGTRRYNQSYGACGGWQGPEWDLSWWEVKPWSTGGVHRGTEILLPCHSCHISPCTGETCPMWTSPGQFWTQHRGEAKEREGHQLWARHLVSLFQRWCFLLPIICPAGELHFKDEEPEAQSLLS